MQNKLVKMFRIWCRWSGIVALLFFASCTGEAEFEPDTNGDTSSPDTGGDVVDKPDLPKTDTAQTQCEPLCDGGQMCKTDGFTCVDCLGDGDCTDQICNTDTNTCVDCKDNSRCTEVAASLCTDGNCGACVMDADCAHLTDTPRCDAGACKVECESDAHCGGKVCDVITNTCTTIDPGTGSQCKSCVSDTQCASTHHCVPLGFGSPNPTPRGNYCLKISTVATPCAEPYGTAFTRDSIGNINAEYCGINEKLTTCEAVLAAAMNTDCKKGMLNEGDDTKCIEDASICRSPSAGVWRCTYNCDNAAQCGSSQTCFTAVMPATGQYCK